MAPSSATITSISATTTGWSEFTSTSGTIRSARCMNNWNFMRGHIIPFNPNTITGADATYDLGVASTNRWRNLYLSGSVFAKVSPTSVSTTGSMTLTTTSDIVLMDSTAATITASLPTHVGNTNTVFTIKNIGTGGKTVLIDPSGTENIENTTASLEIVDGESKTILANNGWWTI